MLFFDFKSRREKMGLHKYIEEESIYNFYDNTKELFSHLDICTVA
jgi:hypothetical protein